MSAPNENWEKSLDGAITELLSARSALNMEPSPIENPEGDYLADIDGWVKHATDHMHAAQSNLRNLSLKMQKLRAAIIVGVRMNDISAEAAARLMEQLDEID